MQDTINARERQLIEQVLSMYGSLLKMFQQTRITDSFIQDAVATACVDLRLAAREACPTPATTIIYDYQVHWTHSSWAGTTSSGWFSYKNSTSQPSVKAFELTLGGPQALVVRDCTGDRSPLYWDGMGLSISERRGIPSHLLLYTCPRLFAFERVGYYLSFGETALGRLMNVYSSNDYTYMGGGLVSYRQRH